MDDEVFETICLDGGNLIPLGTLTERKRYAAGFARLAETQLRAAEHLLGTDAAQMVVGHVYGAMEAKANQLLAVNGYRSKSHVCTQVALSRLLERKDLARPLSRAYRDRQIYEYTSDPGDRQAADTFEDLLGLARTFIDEVQATLDTAR